jgi:hypothetical protein
MRSYQKANFNLIPFVDYLFNILLIFTMILALANISVKKSQGDPAFQQNVIYQLVMDWDGTSPADIDLWAKDPAEHIVGFNRREGGEGSLMALAHDCLGSSNNTTEDKSKTFPANQELIALRGTVQGEYIVNGMCYAKKDHKGDIKVSCKLLQVKPFKEIIKLERILKTNGDEQTFFRFILDKDGKVVSTNELPQRFAQLGSSGEYNGPAEVPDK